jgi:hypothetical protein
MPVVGTEQQVETGLKRGPDVGLGAAAVAAVGDSKPGRRHLESAGHYVPLPSLGSRFRDAWSLRRLHVTTDFSAAVTTPRTDICS